MSSFIYPLAYTEAAREIGLEWDEASNREQVPQTQEARKALIEGQLVRAAVNMGNKSSLAFECYLVPRDGHSTEPQRLRLMASLARQGAYILIHLPDENVDVLPDCGIPLCSLVNRRAA